MQKINFKDNQEPSISDENLNLLQTYIENAINEAKLEAKKEENPVGHIRMETTNVNPSTYLGFGTWKLWGKGRVPVGVDENQIEFNTVEKEYGEKKHKMTEQELVEHTHIINDTANSSSQVTSFCTPKAGGGFENAQSSSGNRLFSFIHNEKTGGSQPFNIIQPSITCYMWKRIS